MHVAVSSRSCQSLNMLVPLRQVKEISRCTITPTSDDVS
jgi:hypothetical protein